MLIDELLDGILRACSAAPGSTSDEIVSAIDEFRRDSPVAEVRTALRYTTHALDAEIALTIDAAKEDMHRVGVSDAQLTGALGRLAITTYARAQQARDPDVRTSFMESYNAIGDALRKAAGT